MAFKKSPCRMPTAAEKEKEAFEERYIDTHTHTHTHTHTYV